MDRVARIEPTRVQTAEFLRSSAFSRWLRSCLKAVIVPRALPENQAVYSQQFDDASRNVEIAIEGLGRLVTHHPVKTIFVVRAILDWLERYYGAQRATLHVPRTLVYTELDHRIPFVPGEDILYTYMIAQIAYVANELAGIVPARTMRHVARGFLALNDLGVETFREHPTVMPRFLNHRRLSLKVIQRLDRPLNCCPSLHIAYSLFLDGIAELLLAPLTSKREVFDSIRFSTIGMFNSVLYTKQHSILDVAFGMLCAKLVFERWFGRPFNSFVSVFPALQRQHPIPYGEIERIFEEACSIQRRAGSLAVTLGTYLATHGFAAVGADQDIDQCHFDTRRRCLVVAHADAPPPEMPAADRPASRHLVRDTLLARPRLRERVAFRRMRRVARTA